MTTYLLILLTVCLLQDPTTNRANFEQKSRKEAVDERGNKFRRPRQARTFSQKLLIGYSVFAYLVMGILLLGMHHPEIEKINQKISPYQQGLSLLGYSVSGVSHIFSSKHIGFKIAHFAVECAAKCTDTYKKYKSDKHQAGLRVVYWQMLRYTLIAPIGLPICLIFGFPQDRLLADKTG